MHALSKKHYYDVMKSGQEDTILESDTSNEDCKREGTPTSEVGCYARAHLKTNSVQTHWNRNSTNFRNESTITDNEERGAVTLHCPINRGGCSINNSRRCEDAATTRSCSFQYTVAGNQQYPLPETEKTAVVVERAVECVECFQWPKKVCAGKSVATMKAKNGDASTQCECEQSKTRISNSDEYQYIPSNRGLAACHTFSLGSLDFCHIQNEQCKTKLIGGWRLPVSKNYKSRF